MAKSKQKITSQKDDFPQWYQDVVREADLAESSEVRGSGVIKPYGYKIWDLIKTELGKRIEDTGAQNVYFPLFVPMKHLQAEAAHVEGFSPELAVVTHAGGEELAEKLAVRPTSEAAMYSTYAKWVQSYQDLPMRLNQWNNVVRWEKRPRAFLRWSEFQWQEGHSVFADEASARAEVWQMLDLYKDMYQYMGIPVIEGQKSEMEKFAGAVMTTTIEAMAKDGKAIQAATSHYLGENFAKVFNVKYQGEDGQEHYAHQTSWGMSWRSVGAVIMVHGDDNGLRLPPNIAPIQIVITPIFKQENKDNVLKYAESISSMFEQYRVHIDDRDNVTPGFKFNHWEVKGVPIRIEIGGKEAADQTVTVYRRDLGEKEVVEINKLNEHVTQLMEAIHRTLYSQAQDFLQGHIHRIESMDEIDDSIGFFEASWSETTESEKILKEKYSMVSRVLPKEFEDKQPKNKKCFITGKEAKHDWYFAKSY